MKTIWQLTYETIPGSGEQIKKFKSFADAKKEIRVLISQIHIQPYTEAIQEEGTHKSYRTAMASFLNDYILRKDFYGAQESLPSSKADDYAFEKKLVIKSDSNEDVDDYDWYDEDEETDWLDDFDIYIGKDDYVDTLKKITFEHNDQEGANLKTNMVVMEDEQQTYEFQYFVGRAPKNKFRELHMTITPLQYWGTASYPVMILRTLEDSQVPLDQRQIISYIKTDYDTTIERKAIGRNIALLKDLGYDIQHNGAGYYIPKKSSALEQNDFQTIVESINCNDALDDDKKRKLIDKLFEL